MPHQTRRIPPGIIVTGALFLLVVVPGIAFNALEPTLTYAALTSAQLERAEQLFGSLNLATTLYQAWIGERVLGLRAFDSTLEDLEGRDNPGVGEEFSMDQLASKMTLNRSPMNALGFFALDQRLLLRTFDRLLALNRVGKWENILQSESVVAEAVATADSFPPKILTAMTLSGQQRVIRGLLSVEARRRCSLLAMATERYRLGHGGKLPATTEEATTAGHPPALTDPYDGKPLRYRPLPNGYVVYSVGPDRQDQEGATVAPAGKSDAFDISFSVENP